MSTRQQAIQEEAHYRVLRMIEENPRLTQRQIADELGISLGGVNYCLKCLVDRGLVKIDNFKRSQNKRGYIYLLTPKGLSEKSVLAMRFLKRKMEEYDSLKAEIEALQKEVADE